jgi:hypothetical protein
MGEESPQISTERALPALVALLAADRDDRADEPSVRGAEPVLGDAGFTHRGIARFTGKNPEAVRGVPRGRRKAEATR